MFKSAIRSVLRSRGYDIVRVRSNVSGNSGFEVYEYLRRDGCFDYGAYRLAQAEGNKGKLANVWVLEENIAFLADYIRRRVTNIKFGLCHGTRRGKEQQWFRQYLQCDVLGTEISDTATQFPHTIQWDFHEAKPEWVGGVDFIYSNSLEHSYDPEKCLNAWMSCLTRDGLCIIEHTSGHERASEMDPFGALISQMPYLILRWGNGAYAVREILDAPAVRETLRYASYLVIQRVGGEVAL